MFGLEDMTYCVADCAMKDSCYRNPALIKESQDKWQEERSE